MSSLSRPIPQPVPTFRVYWGEKTIRDYTLIFSIMDYNRAGRYQITLPSVGYVIMNFITSGSIKRQLNSQHFSRVMPRHLYIHGLQTEGPLVFNYLNRGQGTGMKIHPVVAYHLLRVPNKELINAQTALSNIIDTQDLLLRRLEENGEIDSYQHPGLARFFEKILPDKTTYLRDPIYHAVNLVIRKKGLVSVGQLADHCCMSKRSLNRQFLQKVGVSPKSYAKIWQVQYAMDLLRLTPGRSLVQIAHQSGYYDMSHFFRDFSEKLSQTPTQFRDQLAPIVKNYLKFPSAIK